MSKACSRAYLSAASSDAVIASTCLRALQSITNANHVNNTVQRGGEGNCGSACAGRGGHAAMGSVPSDQPRPPSTTTFIIAGVSGSGKSTIGKQLASRLDSQFFDGDDFHTAASKGERHAMAN